MAKINYLSVFFPAFNESENIDKTIKNADDALQKMGLKDYELIVVDDGSQDDTVKKIEVLQNSVKHLRLVQHKINRGYGSALKTGFDEARYDWVAFADADGQFDLNEISKFLDLTDNAQFILGYRLRRADPTIRIVANWVWNTTAKILTGLPARDYSCGFKLINKKAYESVLPLKSEEKVTQIELLVKAKRLGYSFAEVGVNHYQRKFGHPTGANLKVVIKSYIDLFRLWLQLLKT